MAEGSNHHGITQFDGSANDFPAWYNKVENYLYEKGFWLPLDTAKTARNADTRRMGYSLIQKFLEGNYALSVKVDPPCSITLLENLREEFQAKSTVNKVRILMEALSKQYVPGENLRTHITSIQTAYQNLEYHGSISIEALPAINLMLSLPEDYDGILSQFMRKSEEELKFQDIARAVIEEETRRNLRRTNVAQFVSKKPTKYPDKQQTSRPKSEAKGPKKRCNFEEEM